MANEPGAGGEQKVYVIDAGLVTRQFIEAGLLMISLKQSSLLIITVTITLNCGLVYTSWVVPSTQDNILVQPAVKSDVAFHWKPIIRYQYTYSWWRTWRYSSLFYPPEYTQGVVFEDDNVKVEALRVQHPPVDDCFALKFETIFTIVFGADTAYHTPLLIAKDVDILVHEAMHMGGAQKFVTR